MIAIPAIDLREGACVQLVGGEYDAERVRRHDPLQVLREWERCGFRRTHIVDLDAATQRGSNAATVESLLGATTITAQVGGGVRSDEQIRALRRAGARYVILGTRALDDLEWLARVAREHADTIIVATDVRDAVVLGDGWQRGLAPNVFDLVAALNPLPLAGLLVTAVHREGRMAGPDLTLAEQVAARSTASVFAAGGIASLRDLNALAERGIAGAVIGMALYVGALDPYVVAQEFVA